MARQLVLASTSPRRHALLARLGPEAAVRPADVDETPRPGESAAALVRRLARSKATAVATVAPAAVVLAGDTVVEHRGQILGQPRDRAHARDMLRSFRADIVTVWSHVALATPDGLDGTSVTTELHLAAYPDAAVDAYVAGGEADDKAGALAVQGDAGALVDRVVGCWSNVVGLPICGTTRLLRSIGFAVPGGPPDPVVCAGIACLPDPATDQLRPPDRLRRRC